MQLTGCQPKAQNGNEQEKYVYVAKVPDKSRGRVCNTEEDKTRSEKEAFDFFF